MLALALAAVFHPSLTIVIGVITFFSWAGISRIVRGQTLSLKEKEYIEAARSIGAGPWRIMFVDILPNLLGPVLVLATLYIPTAVTFEATLSFLGIGIPPPAPCWGNILGEAQSYYQIAWWYVVFPAGALLITTLAFNLLGDGIRDAMDPRTERHLRRQQGCQAPARARATAGPTQDAHGRASLPLRARRADAMGMVRFLIRRILAGILVLWVVATGTFFLFFNAVPPQAVARNLAGRAATPQVIAEVDQVLRAGPADIGPVLALPDRAAAWQPREVILPPGTSHDGHQAGPAADHLARHRRRAALAGRRVSASASCRATRARSLFDRVATVGVLAGFSAPTFVVGELLIIFVFVQLNDHGIGFIQTGYTAAHRRASSAGWGA